MGRLEIEESETQTKTRLALQYAQEGIECARKLFPGSNREEATIATLKSIESMRKELKKAERTLHKERAASGYEKWEK